MLTFRLLAFQQHDFSLEKKVLYWIDSALRQEIPWFNRTSNMYPTAPPCWLLLVDSKENLASSHKATSCKTKEMIRDLGQRPEEQEGSEGKDRPKTSPGHLTPRQSTYFLDNVKNELEGAKKKLLAVMHPLNRTHSRSSRNFRFGAGSPPRLAQTLIPTPPPPTSCCKPSRSAGLIGPIQHHKPTMASLSPYSCLPPPPGTQQPLSPHRAHPDSTTDLLSVLSQEERELIEPVVALGYPIRRAILALQKTGRQSLGQFLSYLSACDRLLKQGYEEAQVIEAMEMFQNSEKKALEFLRLLAQFNDMGFRQADIKEVLLLCENHRDRALEELMTQSQ
uniref:Ubiquitin associated protein 1 like n=1 Tax=Pseudonaja textilis TaxID=8673 RepID=A0A670ZJ59_PSETE